MTITIHTGDALSVLKTLPDESVHCCVTSPPYWGLRDYGTAKWEGGNDKCDHSTTRSRGDDIKQNDKQGTSVGSRPNTQRQCACGAIRIDTQMGLESTPEAYVAAMVDVFREVKRVLRNDGTCWLNLGDSYAGGNGRWGGDNRLSVKQSTNRGCINTEGFAVPVGLKPKDLVGIPWRVAFALQSDGWYLRSDIIWAKPNPMPESVTDRPTKSHEYIFLLTKSERYFFDAEAVKERAISTDNSDRDRDSTKLNNTPGRTPMGGLITNHYLTRNIRSVWNIATQPYSEAHFAVFPEAVPAQCIKAGTSEHGVCTICSAPWKRLIEVTDTNGRLGKSYHNHQDDLIIGQRGVPPANGAPTKRTVGWQPTCTCNAGVVRATVLDPFSGSGTTGLVAAKLGRNYIGIELNPEYVAMSKRRLEIVEAQDGLF